ncbi:uncharacterized protein J4E92_009765 [Alternaria infectoria]|uniref:uncharacterized protein n=1 Tax=Alternaria infectoria TaxID=45303 RepID=UPI00221FDA32|nr:uncharacterized protein J4E92_009765 [Alternaria infectoria]KAI4913416.1 hypothetical protein J4E92_009765 [Alternaria infectoria]
MLTLKLLSLAGLFTTTAAQTTNPTIRYMPFGDSITEIICWRSKLWQRLQTTPFNSSTVDFVGSGKTENNCADTSYDRDNEGHSGFLAIDIANKGQLDGWLKSNPADVITMHLGTNDIVQQNKAVADIIKAFGTLVGSMRGANPRMKIVVNAVSSRSILLGFALEPEVFSRVTLGGLVVYQSLIHSPSQVAQIIPMGFGSYNTNIQDLNRAIVPWAQGLNTTESPIWVVDQYAGFSGTADLRDGIHPNDSGDVKMANVWFPAVVKAFEAVRADRGTAVAMIEREFAG